MDKEEDCKKSNYIPRGPYYPKKAKNSNQKKAR